MGLDELIEVLEGATGPSRELDFQIWAHVAGVNLDELRSVFPDFQGWMAATCFTAYIDAALTLVPEGWTWAIDATAPSLGVDCQTHNGDRKTLGIGLTAPLAICIAALKARRAAA